tara:strand:+ start:181 stop:792 length:612 start_codon:yes stop_codon:yes gene_type:complete
MPTQEETRGMKELIQKLNESSKISTTDKEQKSNPKLKANLLNSVSKDAQGMYDILQRLDEATTKVAEEAVEEAYEDPMMAVATKKGNSVKIAEYEITMDKQQVVPGIKKVFYTIKEDGKVLHEQVALFETAMGVVKGLMHGKTGNIKQLLDLDVRYGSQLAEAAFYKQKSKVSEGFKLDLAMAKQGQAVQKMNEAKKQIKSCL